VRLEVASKKSLIWLAYRRRALYPPFIFPAIMDSLEAFSELLEVLYSAPLQQEQWQRFLTLLSKHTQSEFAVLLCANSRSALSISTRAWMGGSNKASEPGVYGTLGVPATGNIPGARAFGATWADSSGNSWLFGGSGEDASGASNYLNDIWEFAPTANEWAWMGGSSLITCPTGQTSNCGEDPTFGVLGVPAPEDNPGGRVTDGFWTDKSHNFWLFGSNPDFCACTLNDLWEFIPAKGPAAAPTFTPPAGTYNSVQTVNIVDATPGATFSCTTIGTTPTTSSNSCNGPITVSTTETIEAIAVAKGYMQSVVASATYKLVAATPTFSIPSGIYTSAQLVTLQDATPGATIYFTINGATPTDKSTPYTEQIPVNAPEAIKAIATFPGFETSEVGTAKYVIAPVALLPIFTPSAGTYASKQSVKVTDTTKGATIYYTTNGMTPTTKSTKYTKPISVSKTETIKAISIAKGFSNSPVALATYTITP